MQPKPHRLPSPLLFGRHGAVKEEPPQKLRWHYLGNPRKWLLIVLLVVGGYSLWREYDYRTAVREAEEEGFEWIYENTFTLIGQDWHNTFRKETWRANKRYLDVGVAPDLAPSRDLIQRLRPTWLHAAGCENIDALAELKHLNILQLENCPTLQNVDALKELNSLHSLVLFDCPTLQNLNGIHNLTGLQRLNLGGCRALKNVDALKRLTNLQAVILNFCIDLENVDALKSLTGLQRLYLHGCEKIPTAALRELRNALPNTDITFPNGTKSLHQ